MKDVIYIEPLGRFGLFANKAMIPIMRWCAGRDAKNESPRQTHFWNRHVLGIKFADSISKHSDKMVLVTRNTSAKTVLPFISHIPRWGGWKDYIVIEPFNFMEKENGWYVGWIYEKSVCVSRIKLTSGVRLLKLPEDCFVFGISHSTGFQIYLMTVGFGTIGKGGKYSSTPLL